MLVHPSMPQSTLNVAICALKKASRDSYRGYITVRIEDGHDKVRKKVSGLVKMVDPVPTMLRG